MEIGKKLKAARSRAGLTQEQVAEHLFVSRQTISNWENEKSYPDIVSVVRLSDLYSISLDELLKEAGCELVVLEVGLGGALDSTNAIDAPEAAVIANIGVFLVCLLTPALLPDSVLAIACVFCLAVAGVACLLYQIVKRI